MSDLYSEKAAQAVEIVRQVAQGQSGRLKVGFSGFATYSILPKALRIFRERFPRVELELEEMTTTAQVQALQEQQIHVGLMIPPIPDATLSLEPILREPLVVILPETHPLATQPELTLPMLANESFILVSRHLEPGYYDQCISLFQQAGFTPKVVQKASQKQTILGLVSAHLGVSLAPASIRNIHRTGVVYITLNTLNAEVELVAVWRQDELLPVLRTFLEVMKEVVGQNCSPIL
jgi:DNA-binding transcriptional LysR family regulator